MDLQNVAVEDLVKGYTLHGEAYSCLFCAAGFCADEVFAVGARFLTAEGMVKAHIVETHGSPFHAIVALDKKVTGLSDVQMEMLTYFYEGVSDQEIVHQSHVTSVSTVRQHRFKLREKEKQAKLFLALMQLMKEPEKFTIHKGAKQVDERYGIEVQERVKVLSTYFKKGLDGGIETIPSKEKKKLIVLQHIVRRFEQGKVYTEKEVNDLLKNVHSDFVSLRRHLIEYGFMERSKDGSVYTLRGE